MLSIALLGDSIFDNKAYTGGEPDVTSHLNGLVPASCAVKLHAVDGSLLEDIAGQIRNLDSATHIVISAGGNNAILNADVLQMRASSSAEVLMELWNRAAEFEKRYEDMIAAVLEKGLPTAISTIYYPNFSDGTVQRLAVAALTLFNDVILRQACLNGLPVLDLRLVCNEPADYANEIEPSGRGGKKIASAIARMLSEHDFEMRKTQIYF